MAGYFLLFGKCLSLMWCPVASPLEAGITRVYRTVGFLPRGGHRVQHDRDSPPAMYGRSEARTVPADERMRVEFRLRASTVRQLTIMSNESGAAVTRILERLVDSALRQE